jgi:hypothetical protein
MNTQQFIEMNPNKLKNNGLKLGSPTNESSHRNTDVTDSSKLLFKSVDPEYSLGSDTGCLGKDVKVFIS